MIHESILCARIANHLFTFICAWFRQMPLNYQENYRSFSEFQSGFHQNLSRSRSRSRSREMKDFRNRSWNRNRGTRIFGVGVGFRSRKC